MKIEKADDMLAVKTLNYAEYYHLQKRNENGKIYAQCYIIDKLTTKCILHNSS